jgi:hypothetical protein
MFQLIFCVQIYENDVMVCVLCIYISYPLLESERRFQDRYNLQSIQHFYIRYFLIAKKAVVFSVVDKFHILDIDVLNIHVILSEVTSYNKR